MDPLVKEYFRLMQCTQEISGAIGAGDDRGIARGIDSRARCLEAIRELEKAGPVPAQVMERVRGVLQEAVELERKNHAAIRRLRDGLKARIRQLHQEQVQLGAIQSGYCRRMSTPQPRLLNRVF